MGHRGDIMIFAKRKTKGGFTIIEMLISLAILALLMSAVATAFYASAVNYRENEDIFRAVHTARQVLYRITMELRTATAVKHDDPANECSMVTAEGSDITYRYNSGDNTLYLITNDDATDADYVFCDNVTAMTFVRTFDTGDPTVVKNVQINMTVAAGNVSQTVATAAVVRRNM